MWEGKEKRGRSKIRKGVASGGGKPRAGESRIDIESRRNKGVHLDRRSVKEENLDNSFEGGQYGPRGAESH